MDRVINVGQVYAYGAGALDQEGVTLVWGHYDPQIWPAIVPLCRVTKPVVPVRDPLAVAVSHVIRGNTFNALFWAMGVDALDTAKAHYVPLDLLTLPHSRKAAMLLAARAAGYGREYDGLMRPCAAIDAHCNKWADAWPREHCFGDHELKRLYAAGDFAALEKRMPDEVAALRREARGLRPWLERIGYRDLGWWN